MWPAAAGDYRRVLKANPLDREVALALARALRESGDEAGAKAVMEALPR